MGADLTLEASFEEILEEGLRRMHERGTWKVRGRRCSRRCCRRCDEQQQQQQTADSCRCRSSSSSSRQQQIEQQIEQQIDAANSSRQLSDAADSGR